MKWRGRRQSHQTYRDRIQQIQQAIDPHLEALGLDEQIGPAARRFAYRVIANQLATEAGYTRQTPVTYPDQQIKRWAEAILQRCGEEIEALRELITTLAASADWQVFLHESRETGVITDDNQSLAATAAVLNWLTHGDWAW